MSNQAIYKVFLTTSHRSVYYLCITNEGEQFLLRKIDGLMYTFKNGTVDAIGFEDHLKWDEFEIIGEL